jgi:hypothetical protein
MIDEDRQYVRFTLDYQLQTPMRIGHRKIGNLQTTRLFVPGIAVWASAVNQLARHFAGRSPDGKNPCQYWGEFLRSHCRFSCLFFCDPKGSLILPGDPDRPGDGQEIAREFLDGSTHTAINHRAMKAEEGSLHELEWILPIGRSGRKALLEGWIDIAIIQEAGQGPTLDVEDNEAFVSWQGQRARLLQDILNGATVGADLHYDHGRLALRGSEKTGLVAEISHAYRPVPGWLLAGRGERARGQLEAVTGRGWLPALQDTAADLLGGAGAKGYGYYSYLAYLPGARVEPESPLRMRWWGGFGLEEVENNTQETGV